MIIIMALFNEDGHTDLRDCSPRQNGLSAPPVNLNINFTNK